MDQGSDGVRQNYVLETAEKPLGSFSWVATQRKGNQEIFELFGNKVFISSFTPGHLLESVSGFRYFFSTLPPLPVALVKYLTHALSVFHLGWSSRDVGWIKLTCVCEIFGHLSVDGAIKWTYE